MDRGIGDNSGRMPTIRVTLRMFNSLARYGGAAPQVIELPAGTPVAELASRFRVPPDEIYLVLVNGQDVTRRPGAVNLDRVLHDGDAVALSGPVPYSWGYGAPVV
ncbi:MAG: MoaD/ThiS family protein [Actinomycetota bacterium]